MANYYFLFIFLTFCYLCLYDYHLYRPVDLIGNLLHPAGTLFFFLFFRWAWNERGRKDGTFME